MVPISNPIALWLKRDVGANGGDGYCDYVNASVTRVEADGDDDDDGGYDFAPAA